LEQNALGTEAQLERLSMIRLEAVALNHEEFE
jgi:hypothetical protein